MFCDDFCGVGGRCTTMETELKKLHCNKLQGAQFILRKLYDSTDKDPEDFRASGEQTNQI